MMDLEALFILHSDIPREGPGSDEATREAIHRLSAGLRSRDFSDRPCGQILDLGCGPGRQTLVLAAELQWAIAAVDFHLPYLLRLQQAAVERGLDHLITIRHQDMANLEDAPGTIDLIWAEGSIYNLGFANGLKLYRPLLREGGCVVVSEAAWLIDEPPQEVLDFWQEEYPAITTIAGNIKLAEEAGYEVFDHFTLPRSAWWDEYLTPLAKRVRQLQPEASQNSALAEVLAATEKEIDICDRFGDCFGYVFYLMRPVC
jgi:SAM-dependent methyltransferase